MGHVSGDLNALERRKPHHGTALLARSCRQRRPQA